MRTIATVGLACLLAATAAADSDEKSEGATATGDGLMPRVELKTNLGSITLRLNGEKAPISTHNFLQYVESGFYDGLIFHRVMPNFMIQGGGYLPDMTEKKEGVRDPIRNEWRNGLKNKRGTIAFARTTQPDTATCQFFINVVDNAPLDEARSTTGDAAYAVFGEVIEGMNVVDKIKDTPTKAHRALASMGAVVQVDPVIISAARVLGPYDKEKLAAAVRAASESSAAPTAAPADVPSGVPDEVRQYLVRVAAELGKAMQKTDSGMFYFVLQDGEGRTPARTDYVKVHYTGRLLNGRVFDSSVQRGQPAEFALDRVIKGWTEGVSMMKVGEKRRLVIPPDLAYGSQGNQGIPPNSWLIFDVELLGIR